MTTATMHQFIGTKEILATPMTRGEYNIYRGWQLPDDEDGTDFGFLVEYMPDDNTNHPDHAGYISWSPKSVFEGAYQDIKAMTFAHAMTMVMAGARVQRAGWNGKGMFIFLTKGRTVPNNKERSFAHFDGTHIRLENHIDFKAADGSYVSGWLASQTDMTANDWSILS